MSIYAPMSKARDPSFSKDGRWLLFHSDRTGVTNVYAYELATGVLKQVTNVINGAYQPELSPDGRTLLYDGYTHSGWDVYAMAFDPSRFLDALPYLDDRPVVTEPAPQAWEIRPYNSLHTILPSSASRRACFSLSSRIWSTTTALRSCSS